MTRVLRPWELASLAIGNWQADPVLVVGSMLFAFMLQAAVRRDIHALLLSLIALAVALVGILLHERVPFL